MRDLTVTNLKIVLNSARCRHRYTPFSLFAYHAPAAHIDNHKCLKIFNEQKLAHLADLEIHLNLLSNFTMDVTMPKTVTCVVVSLLGANEVLGALLLRRRTFTLTKIPLVGHTSP